MADLAGQTIGPYRLVEKIGAGGMAEVYKAYQPRLDRYVAIKFLRPELVTEAGFRIRFEQEAKTIARLSHAHIVHVYDFGEEGNRYYLVMEFVAEGTLKDRLQALGEAGEIMGLDQVRRIIQQVCAALDYAHQQGIIHRDVKPANIMLTADGRAVLNDFGLAKMVAATSGLTSTGAAIGTPAYMSPEQIEGDKTNIGPASDLYALGVVLYEMVTGRVPFTADTPLAVMLKHLNDPIPLPSVLNPALPEAVERIVLKSLAKDPADRYQKAGELGQDLERALGGSLPAAAPLRPTPQPLRWPRISWLQASVLVVFLLIIVGGIVMAGGIPRTWLPGREKETVATRPPSPTIAALTSPPGTSIPLSEATPISAARATATPAETPISTLTHTPAPTTRPSPVPTFTSPPTPAPAETPELIAIVQRFPAPGRSTGGITWDGTYLWLADNSGTIFQVDTQGRTLGAFQAPEVTPEGLTWDGSSLWLFTTNYSFIYQFRIEGEETKTISSFKSPAKVLGGDITNDLAWDGETLWYANQYNVYKLDTSGEVLRAFAFPKNVMGLGWDGSNLWLAYNDFPSTSTLVVLDAEGSTLASFSSPVFKIEGLAWGDGYLWAVGRDSLGGGSVIYKLDVSRAREVVVPSSDPVWRAKVLSVRESPVLQDTYVDQRGLPQPSQYYAGEGRTFILVELGLKSQVIGTVLYTKDIALADDQGHAYSPVGTRKSVAPMPDEFAVGTLTGTITMSHRDPPALTFEYEIKRVAGSSSTTTQGEMPLVASDGEWPELVLVWLIPADAGGLRLTAPGVSAIQLEESLATPTLTNPPVFGRVLHLDGVDDYATAPDGPDLDVGDEAGESLTIEAWVNFQRFYRAGVIYKPLAYSLFGDADTSGARCIGFAISASPDQPCGGMHCRRPGYSHGWHHVAGVFDRAAAKMTLYLDGEAVLDDDCPAVNNSDAGLKVGKGMWAEETLEGAIEEIRISDVVRYSAPFTPPIAPFTCDEHTRALWHFDEVAGAATFFDGEDGMGSACGSVEDTLTGMNGTVTGP